MVQMIESLDGSAGLLHKITKPTAWRGGAQILKKEEEDARLLDRGEAKRKEWAKHWQCDEEVQILEDEPWKNEELKRSEEALPRLRSAIWRRRRDCTRQRQEWDATASTPKSPGFDKRNERRSGGIL